MRGGMCGICVVHSGQWSSCMSIHCVHIVLESLTELSPLMAHIPMSDWLNVPKQRQICMCVCTHKCPHYAYLTRYGH